MLLEETTKDQIKLTPAPVTRGGDLTLTLVVMAAGLGSRYGGAKQLEAVGPDGATLIDYAVFDALRSGFDDVVLVVRREMEPPLRETVGRRFGAHATVRFAFQEITGVPAGFTVPRDRVKPWGTGQAVLACASLVHAPFAVINADDFYGKAAFDVLATFLRTTSPTESEYAVVGFSLRETLSDTGGVNRAVCRVTGDGWLQGIEETLDIVREGDGGRYHGSSGEVGILAGETPVSMNCWAFTPTVFPLLESGFVEFMQTWGEGQDLKAEYLLPNRVEELIRCGAARVKVLTSSTRWFGVTHRGDKTTVEARIAELIASGEYPARLGPFTS